MKTTSITVIGAVLLSTGSLFGQAEAAGATGADLRAHDIRKISGVQEGFGYRVFKPSARIFFDSGNDDDGEIDIFKDGSITPSIDILELVWRYKSDFLVLPNESAEVIYFGPALGFGIGAPPSDSEDGTEKASSAPILMLSAGVFMEIFVKNDKSIILEAGRTMGITTDESVSDSTDSAWYVGLSFDF